MGLLGVDALHLPAGTISPGVGCALLSMLCAAAWNRRADVPLETAA
jgi:hypothetical protein